MSGFKRDRRNLLENASNELPSVKRSHNNKINPITIYISEKNEESDEIGFPWGNDQIYGRFSELFKPGETKNIMEILKAISDRPTSKFTGYVNMQQNIGNKGVLEYNTLRIQLCREEEANSTNNDYQLIMVAVEDPHGNDYNYGCDKMVVIRGNSLNNPLMYVDVGVNMSMFVKICIFIRLRLGITPNPLTLFKHISLPPSYLYHTINPFKKQGELQDFLNIYK